MLVLNGLANVYLRVLIKRKLGKDRTIFIGKIFFVKVEKDNYRQS